MDSFRDPGEALEVVAVPFILQGRFLNNGNSIIVPGLP